LDKTPADVYSDGKQTWSGINKSEYLRAIELLYVVHNIDYDGDYIFDNFNFFKTAE
jgi:hypothetical protein